LKEGYGLKVERNFEESPSEVFRSWTDPAELKRWYHPREDWITSDAEIDLRVGGSYRIVFSPPGGREYVETGEYLEVNPPSRLRYTLHFKGPSDDFETAVTVDFVEDGAGTKVVVSEDGYPTEEVRDQHQSGWGSFLINLEVALASRTR
jgi:uncharacterized protein YndB with AHSA1/START domain